MTIIKLNLFSYYNKFGMGNKFNRENGGVFSIKTMSRGSYWEWKT